MSIGTRGKFWPSPGVGLQAFGFKGLLQAAGVDS
jgi:hypothetical protein